MALIHIGFFSECLGMAIQCDVILPQTASGQIGMAAGVQGDRHPTLWLLHGASDDHTIWQRRTSIERYAAPLGLAVVMPAVQLSGYANMAHGGRFYDYVAQELPEKMRYFFPLSDRREDNFIAGLSMGGAGCMKIGLARPERFGAIGCLSAGASNRRPGQDADPRRAKYNLMAYGDGANLGPEEDVLGNAKKLAEAGGPCPRIYHACGTEDFLLENARATRDFFTGLPGNPFDYTYEEDPGAHTWEFWDEHIQHFLAFLGLNPENDVRN